MAAARLTLDEARQCGFFWGTIDVAAGSADGVLSSGAADRQIGALLRAQFGAAPPGTVLLVDLCAVRQAGFIVLRELIGTVAAALHENQDRYLLLCADEENADLLASLEIAARERRLVLPLLDRGGGWHTLGRLTKAERDTLALVIEDGAVTAALLRARMGLLTSAASNRLRRLYDLRLVRREERLFSGSGGREYVYRALWPSPPSSLPPR
jgi:hypothetical protein